METITNQNWEVFMQQWIRMQPTKMGCITNSGYIPSPLEFRTTTPKTTRQNIGSDNGEDTWTCLDMGFSMFSQQTIQNIS